MNTLYETVQRIQRQYNIERDTNQIIEILDAFVRSANTGNQNSWIGANKLELAWAVCGADMMYDNVTQYRVLDDALDAIEERHKIQGVNVADNEILQLGNGNYIDKIAFIIHEHECDDIAKIKAFAGLTEEDAFKIACQFPDTVEEIIKHNEHLSPKAKVAFYFVAEETDDEARIALLNEYRNPTHIEAFELPVLDCSNM